MDKNVIKSEIELLGIDVADIDIENLMFQLTVLEKKIKLVENINNLEEYTPKYTFKKSSDDFNE